MNSLWNMLVNIKNGQLAKRSFIIQLRQKKSELFLKFLWQQGFINGYQIYFKNPQKLKIFLKFKNNKSVINSIQLVSKPGKRIYYSAIDIFKINSNKSFFVFFTQNGLKSIVECKKNKIGGEIFIVLN